MLGSCVLRDVHKSDTLHRDWLWGWDPTPGIVSVWAEPDGRAHVWRRDLATLALLHEETRFRPWILLDTLDDLQGLGARLAREEYAWARRAFDEALGLDPDHFNQTDNDLAAPTAGTNCLATATYGDGTNQGTPGTANPQCP